MTDKKIEQIANFMYSADNNQEVPFRISLMFGMGGFDLTIDGLVALLQTLRDKPANKKTLSDFLEEAEQNEWLL